MQVPNAQKRKAITDTAAKMFASLPFHKVRLDDIAAEAGVGKGTLYVYFNNKEDLYFSLIYDGFAQLVDRLTTQLAGAGERGRPGQSAPAVEVLRRIVRELVGFAFQHPSFWELMRNAGVVKESTDPSRDQKRRDFTGLIERTIRRGVGAGEFSDPHPELTALCLPGMVRSLMLFGPRELDADTVSAHIVRLLERGIVKQDPKEGSPTR